MKFDLAELILILIPATVGFVIILRIKDNRLKWLGLAFQVGFFVYSGLGMAFYDINHKMLFTFQYSISTILFSIIFFASQRSNEIYIKRKRELDSSVLEMKNGLIPKVFAFVYIITFIFPFFYPSIDIVRAIDVRALLTEYHALSSAYKLSLQQDSLYQFVCTIMRTLCLPGFLIYLYSLKEKPFKFIVLFFIPTYLYAMSNYYISRNELAVFLLFVFVYLYKEEVVSRHILRIAGIISIPVFTVFFVLIYYSRIGMVTTITSFSGFAELLFSQEVNFVKNYSMASQLSNEVSPIEFFSYVLTCFIPLSIRGLVGITEVNLARILSNNILSLTYGDSNYYLLLPSVLGEGTMVFDQYFAWVYICLFALILLWFFRRMRRTACLDYLLIYFIIDVFRQIRGGSQFVISSWTAALIPFLIICYLIRQLALRPRR